MGKAARARLSELQQSAANLARSRLQQWLEWIEDDGNAIESERRQLLAAARKESEKLRRLREKRATMEKVIRLCEVDVTEALDAVQTGDTTSPLVRILRRLIGRPNPHLGANKRKEAALEAAQERLKENTATRDRIADAERAEVRSERNRIANAALDLPRKLAALDRRENALRSIKLTISRDPNQCRGDRQTFNAWVQALVEGESGMHAPTPAFRT